MPNLLDANGLQTQSQVEMLAQLTTAFQGIYGLAINLASNTQDGQCINIFIQAALDILDLIVQVYNSFDPDQAIGITLDMRVGLNGIQRQKGTYTITNVTVVVDRAMTINGLDDAFPLLPLYAVQDNQGNVWNLITSQAIAGPGTYVFAFQANVLGAVQTVIGTITVPSTVVLGVTSINNPTAFTSLGQNQETDAQLKIRRQSSTSINAQGVSNALRALLKNIPGVTAAFVYENDTGAADVNGVSGHSVWCVVQGGAAADIAQAIYTKRNLGCGIFSLNNGFAPSISLVITQSDGSPFLVQWDVVTAQPLFIQVHASSIDVFDALNTANLAKQIAAQFIPGIGAEVNINALATVIQSIDSNCLVVPTVGDGFALSSFGPFSNLLTPTAKNNQFSIFALPTLGDVALGTNTILNVGSIAGIVVGMPIYGPGIPNGANILTAAGTTITFTGPAATAATLQASITVSNINIVVV